MLPYGAERCRVIGLVPGEHGPEGARQLVRHGGHNHVVRASPEQRIQPGHMPMPQDHRPRAMHEQGAQIDVPSLGEAQLPNPAAGAALSRYQAEPGRELAAGLEGPGFAGKAFASAA